MHASSIADKETTKSDSVVAPQHFTVNHGVQIKNSSGRMSRGSARRSLSVTESTEEACEPLMSPVDAQWGRDEIFEAAKSRTAAFSWSEYCSFFVIGLSMMWTWYEFPVFWRKRLREDC